MMKSVNETFFFDVLLLLANVFFFKKNENRTKNIQQVHFLSSNC